MKPLALLLIVALSATATAWAQPASPTSTPPPGTPAAGANQPTLTPQEWQELRAARAAALQANPNLLAENQKLIARMRALQDKLDAVMIKADPTLAPIIAKFEGGRPHPMPPPTAPAEK
jgi:hypothetical protein